MPPVEIDVKYVAHLARLSLTPEEEQKIGAQLGNILGYIEKLKEVDVSGVEPTAHARVMPVTPAVAAAATVDETTYTGGKMGPDHPVAWCRKVGQGRMWYTAMGHTESSFSEPLFREHLLGGIRLAAGELPADSAGGPVVLIVEPRLHAMLAEGLEANTHLLTYIFNMILADHRTSLKIRSYRHPMDPMNLLNEVDPETVRGAFGKCKSRLPSRRALLPSQDPDPRNRKNV